MTGRRFQFAAALIGGLQGGQWLDRRHGTVPVFLFLGVANGGMTALYGQQMRMTRDEEEASKR